MNILITGITGFVGTYLAEELLLQLGDSMHLIGTCRTKSLPETLQAKVTLFSGDLRDKSFVHKVIEESQPEWIFHLSALSSGKESFTAAQETIMSNLQMQLHLFTAVQELQMNSKFLIIGSGEEYGMVKKEDNPIDELQPLDPVSPYGFSKVAQDLVAYTYYKSFGLQAIRIRAFNHTGPRQHHKFVVPSFAKQIAEIENASINLPAQKGLAQAGKQEAVIKVGNLKAVRDFTDVRDMVRAYILAMQKGEAGEVYNLGSGKGYEISKLLETLINLAKTKISIEVDKERLRPIDLPVTICNCEKFKKLTQWEPQISIEQTLEDILIYWRNSL